MTKRGPDHGIPARYRTDGCRCDLCTEAMKACWRKGDAKRTFNATGRMPKPKMSIRQIMAANPNDPRHGTLRGYRYHGCRCDECTAAQETSGFAYSSSSNVHYSKREDIGDAIRRTKPIPIQVVEPRKAPSKPKVNWGDPMPFEKRKFDSELTRNRGCANI